MSELACVRRAFEHPRMLLRTVHGRDRRVAVTHTPTCAQERIQDGGVARAEAAEADVSRRAAEEMEELKLARQREEEEARQEAQRKAEAEKEAKQKAEDETKRCE